MSAKKGLGRSFDSLIPTELLDESFDPTSEQDDRVSDLRYIKLSEIVPDPDQPRRAFDEVSLDELAASVKEHGVLQPIVVAPDKQGYKIVAGERRFRASQRAGLEKIPALVRTLSSQHKLELSLIENLQRSDLNPLETATAYLKLRDQFNLTLEEIGQRVGGKTSAAISNTLRLLRLPASARDAIIAGDIREGQARPLIGLPEDVVDEIIPRIIKEGWSARAIESYVRRQKANGLSGHTTRQPAPRKPRYVKEQTHFADRFKTPVEVRTNRRGSGQIVISFQDHADFERISKLLG